jgi:arylsulfatase A-like enzyme
MLGNDISPAPGRRRALAVPDRINRRRLLKFLAALPAGLALESRFWQGGRLPALAISEAEPDGQASIGSHVQGTVLDPRHPGPNLLLITVDSLRADHLGAYGYPRPITPYIDRLATDGVLVDRAYTVMPSTNPAHAALLTGAYPGRNGVYVHMVEQLPHDVPTLAENLFEAGYTTAGFFSWHSLEPRFSGLQRGFEVYRGVPVDREAYVEQQHSPTIPPEERAERLVYDLSSLPDEVALSEYVDDLLDGRADITTDVALRWLDRERTLNRPFFLWVHYFDPHYPYSRPHHSHRSAPSATDSEFGGGCEGCPSGEMATIRRIIAELQPDFSPSEIAHLRSQYDQEIAFADEQIGRLLAGLGERGLENNTAVVLTADHGESFGEHGLWLHGSGLYSHEVRVPLLLRYPNHLPGGQVLRGPVSLVDVMPTLLELADLPIPASVQGTSLLPLLAGTELDGQRRIFSVASEPSLAITTDDWRLIHHLTDDRVELYRLSTDSVELENLAPRPPPYEAETPASEVDDADLTIPIASLATDVQAENLRPRLDEGLLQASDPFAYTDVVSDLLAELRAWQATLMPSAWPVEALEQPPLGVE